MDHWDFPLHWILVLPCFPEELVRPGAACVAESHMTVVGSPFALEGQRISFVAHFGESAVVAVDIQAGVRQTAAAASFSFEQADVVVAVVAGEHTAVVGWRSAAVEAAAVEWAFPVVAVVEWAFPVANVVERAFPAATVVVVTPEGWGAKIVWVTALGS